MGEAGAAAEMLEAATGEATECTTADWQCRLEESVALREDEVFAPGSVSSAALHIAPCDHMCFLAAWQVEVPKLCCDSSGVSSRLSISSEGIELLR